MALGIKRKTPLFIRRSMMHKALPKLLILTIVPLCLYAQTCHQVSGQTRPFLFKAGATAGWDNPGSMAQKPHAVSFNNLSFFITQNSNGRIVFSTGRAPVPYPLTISIFSVTGKKITSLGLEKGLNGSKVFNGKLANGVYFARLAVNGACVRTARFLVRR
jgi:hypothetical protein